MEMQEIIERVGYFRNKLNLSARELSLRIDKHDSYINKLESGAFNLPVATLLRIIDALEITPQAFFADNYTTYGRDEELRILLKQMSSEKRQNLLEFLKQ